MAKRILLIDSDKSGTRGTDIFVCDLTISVGASVISYIALVHCTKFHERIEKPKSLHPLLPPERNVSRRWCKEDELQCARVCVRVRIKSRDRVGKSYRNNIGHQQLTRISTLKIVYFTIHKNFGSISFKVPTLYVMIIIYIGPCVNVTT